MKTPREILLEHHRPADAKLSQIRRDVIVQMETPATQRFDWLPLRALLTLWHELIWPARRIWAGLAAAWILIVAVNMQVAGTSAVASRQFTPPSPATLMALREQERQLIELTEAREPSEADRPKPSPPRPRSEARLEFLIT